VYIRRECGTGFALHPGNNQGVFMKKVILAMVILASSLTVHAGAHDKGNGQVGSVVDMQFAALADAENYGLCISLKKRAPIGDEAGTQIYCPQIIKYYELNMERKSLVKRIQQIDADLKTIQFNGMP
jgi:hypothetical protein